MSENAGKRHILCSRALKSVQPKTVPLKQSPRRSLFLTATKAAKRHGPTLTGAYAAAVGVLFCDVQLHPSIQVEVRKRHL